MRRTAAAVGGDLEVIPPLTRFNWLVIALTSAAVGLAALTCINGSTVTKDAAQNVRMAVNLDHQGIVSLDTSAPYRPSMYREPLPIATSAAAVALADSILGPAPYTAYLDGARVEIIKYQNVPWLLLIWATAAATLRLFTKSFYLGLFGGILAVIPFLSTTNIDAVNDLYTELPATALLGLASYLLMLAVTGGRAWKSAACGACFGLLVLTKASFLYVFLGLLAALSLTFFRTPAEWRKCSLRAGLMAASFALVIVPWIGRNVHEFGQARISERGGLAIYTRALMNQMSREEYRGTFYFWARPAIRPFIGSLLGFTPADLGPGGRLARLNTDPGAEAYQSDLAAELAGRPQDAVSFYRRGRAERERLETQFEQSGAPDPDVASDTAMASAGAAMVKSDLLSDLALTIPLLWRSAPLIFPTLLLAFGYALWVRRDALLLYTFPGIAYLSFYALVTPFEPRPAVITRALAVVAIFTVLHGLGTRVSDLRGPDRRRFSFRRALPAIAELGRRR
jgi:hypothetical protein